MTVELNKIGRLLGVTAILAALTLPVDQLLKFEATKEFLVTESPGDTTIYQGRRQEVFTVNADHAWMSLTKTYVRNHGASWGLWSGLDSRWRLSAILLMGLVATTVLFYGAVRLISSGNPWAAYSMCGVIAGSFGNLIDRIRLGYVVDFLTLKFAAGTWAWTPPSFNLADIIILLCLFSLITTLFRRVEQV